MQTTWNGGSYCLVPEITDLTSGTYPAGTALGFTGAYVTGVDAATVTLSALVACPAGMYCGALLTFTDVTATFAPGTIPAVYGEVVDVYGHTVSGRFVVDGYDVVVPCEYALGCG